MLIGVGIGDGVESAICASIKDNNPNYVAFLTTKESKLTLDRSIDQDNDNKQNLRNLIYEYEVFDVENPEDLNSTFQSCERALNAILKKGYVNSEIVVDITSGTKVMSACIAILAMTFQLFEVVYVGGIRNDRGIVIKGSEKPQNMKPIRILLKQKLQKVRDYLSLYQYHSSGKIVSQLNTYSWILSPTEKEFVSDLKELCDAYLCWERFDHKNALKHFQQIKSIDTSPHKDYLKSLRNDVTTFASEHPDLRGKVPTKSLIVDVFHNAKRRSTLGDFDDAIARLYRCLEMIGQYQLLSKFKLVTSNLQLVEIKNKIPLELYERIVSNTRGSNKLVSGLVENFEILSFLDKDDPISIKYLKCNDALKASLSFRNQSILAHGTDPVGKEKYDKMENLCMQFIESMIENLNSKMDELDRCFKIDFLSDYFKPSK